MRRLSVEAMKELLKDFAAETAEQLEAIGEQLVRFEREPSDARILANIFRLIHAIKGTCGFLSLPRLERLAHAAETLIEALRQDPQPSPAHVSMVLAAIDRVKSILAEIGVGLVEPSGDDSALIAEMARFEPPARGGSAAPLRVWEASLTPSSTPLERRADTVRIPLKTLEAMTALVQELTLARNQLEDAAEAETNPRLREAVERISAVSRDLHASVYAVRMQSFERLFVNFERLVSDLSAKLGKKIAFVAEGGAVELDRQLIEAVRDPLTHLIRNAVDHGIEPPQERIAAGKPEIGEIRVTARRDAARVSITVSDDGRGIDAAKVRERAVVLGLGTHERIKALDEASALRLVFMPSFTTAGSVSTISGRGVGLDIVRTNIEAIGGAIALESRPGQGVSIALTAPLIMATTPAMVLRCGGQRYLIAQANVESVEMAADGTHLEAMPDALRWRSGEVSFPAVRLSRLLGEGAPERTPAEEAGLHVRVGSERFVLIVDDVDEVLEIVLKPLPPEVPLPALYAGVAILNDGDVVLALDAAGVAETLGLAAVVTATARAAPLSPPIVDLPLLAYRFRFAHLARRAAAGHPVDRNRRTAGFRNGGRRRCFPT